MAPEEAKKEFGYRCKSYKKKNKAYFVITLQGFLNGEWDWIDVDEEFFCDNARYEDIVSSIEAKVFTRKILKHCIQQTKK